MSTDGISESTFLLTELRYTLGQLNVQLGDLNAQQEQHGPSGAPSVDQILKDMTQAEQRCQQQYAKLTGVSAPDLPVSDAGSPAEAFERLRLGTITQLEQVGSDWSPELREAVRQQVANDRQRTTQIANDRRNIFEHDQRPDLNEPLTRPQ